MQIHRCNQPTPDIANHSECLHFSMKEKGNELMIDYPMDSLRRNDHELIPVVRSCHQARIRLHCSSCTVTCSSKANNNIQNPDAHSCCALTTGFQAPNSSSSSPCISQSSSYSQNAFLRRLPGLRNLQTRLHWFPNREKLRYSRCRFSSN